MKLNINIDVDADVEFTTTPGSRGSRENGLQMEPDEAPEIEVNSVTVCDAKGGKVELIGMLDKADLAGIREQIEERLEEEAGENRYDALHQYDEVA